MSRAYSGRGIRNKYRLDEMPKNSLSKFIQLRCDTSKIDDESGMLPEQLSHFVQTNPQFGITKKDADSVLKILNIYAYFALTISYVLNELKIILI